jgi:glycosyltransferase involved in cell wall biosynthesis
MSDRTQVSSIEVVICTRDRAAELRRCLLSIITQTVTSLTVFVVDGGDDDASLAVVEEARAGAPPDYTVKYMKTPAGLTRQRNAAVEHLEPSTEYVCFIDDDAVIAPEYVAAIERAFRLDKCAEVVGVGGLIQNPPPRPYPFLRRIFFLDSKRGGAVLPSGVNVQLAKADGPTYVDWITGCAMSFRRSIFGEFRFDSSLQGYSLGEDVEFTFRLSRRYKLLVTPDAHLWHLRADAGRDDEVSYAREQILFRYRLVRAHPQELSVVAFAWCCFGEILQNVTYLSPRRLRRQFRRALGLMLGLWDIARLTR